MLKSFVRWVGERQRAVLQGDKKMETIQNRAQSIDQRVTQQRRNEMRIAEISMANPVYARIKGRTQ